MRRFESVGLGEYRGQEYLLVGSVDPAPEAFDRYDPGEQAESYGVTVARSVVDPFADTVEVVRMGAAHGRPHLDLCYLPPDADRKHWLDEEYGDERMKRFLLANWKQFADRAIDRGE